MVNTDIFLGSGASTTLVPELRLMSFIDESASSTTSLALLASFSTNRLLVPNLYIGCRVELYDSGDTANPVSVNTITGNTENAITITPANAHALDSGDGDFCIIQPYGAPCPATKVGANSYKLNADQWLGIVESSTFPNTEVEMKQVNLSLGGSRNYTYQYKGIETASGGNINIVANHGAFLYYALGRCSGVKCTSASGSTVPASFFLAQSGTTNQVYIDTGDTSATTHSGSFETAHLEQGPIFYRSAGDEHLMPPVVHGSDTTANLNKLTVPTFSSGAIQNPITYEFSEANGEDLPSFTLEHSMTKTTSVTPTEGSSQVGGRETESVVRFARGNRVNTLSMTANENEEIKMTMDLNTRTVDYFNDLTTTQVFTPRGGVSDNTALFNYSSDPEALEPFFFSSGVFSIFGHTFAKITNMTLTINNNLADRRFIGVGNKKIKEAIPAQRTYEISFTALITDDRLLTELLNNTENTGASQKITLQFDKSSGEQILIEFQDYFLSSANVTIPDDKGAITIEGTVMPRTMSKCEVKTHWILQG